MRSGPRKFLIFWFFLLVGSVSPLAAEPQELVISAAASLKNVLEAIGGKFEAKHPGTKVLFNFGSSGALSNQVFGGAPVDLLFTADIREFQKLEERRSGQWGGVPDSLVAKGYPKPFARNELVFITPRGSSLTLPSLAALKKNEWQKVAMGNARTVPAGRYAEEALRSEGFTEGLGDRLVPCENARQVLDYVIRGEVDGGFVYRTDAMAARPGDVNIVFAVPPETHSPIVYGMGRMTSANAPDLAEQFLAFVALPESQEILATAGFRLTEK